MKRRLDGEISERPGYRFFRGYPMSSNAVSIFDLSPAEKLQLVEDLWDDLATNPSTIPVHEWHKEELERRKANLMNNPTSALSWDQVKQRIRAHHDR
jgi:putative addiction module component (TIGR02574 family)